MKRAHLKPLKNLTKRQFRKRVAESVQLHSFLPRPFLEDDSESDESLSVDERRESISRPLNHRDENVYIDMNVDENFAASETSSEVDNTGVINMENSHMGYTDGANFGIQLAPTDMRTFLKNWATDYGLPQTQLKPLLHKLKEHECFREEIPKDPRTLLGTSSGKTDVKTIRPGSYYHFGLKIGIREILSKYPCWSLNSMKMKVGIDGVPISNSSGAQFWPILGSIDSLKDVFMIGAYFGHEKPTLVEEFLDEFLTEAETLCADGLEIREEILTCEIQSIIADAPAKAYILNVKAHTGFHSCTKCTIKGKWIRGRACFLHGQGRVRKRTNARLRARKYKKHQTGSCCLGRIQNFDFVKNFPLDYMHLVCLGCMRKLLNLWVIIRKGRCLQKWEILKMSKRLRFIRKFVPQEFQRKPRSLKVLRYWKATELRQFLLYTGPMVTPHILTRAMYEHFNTLHVAIRILCSPSLVNEEDYLDYAGKLLSHFVMSLANLYGECYVSYNVHGLTHLVDDVRNFGKLDNFSAFEFENLLQYTKKWMRKGDKPLQQLVRRYSESKANSSKPVEVQGEGIQFCQTSEHYSGPLLDNCSSPQFRVLTINGLKLDVSKKGDKCFGLSTGEIVLINNVAHSVDTNEPVVIGKEFRSRCNPYEIPCQSSLVDEFTVKDLSHLRMWPLKNVTKKYIIVPKRDNEYLVSSLLHTN